jgi:hypothetical protein
MQVVAEVESTLEIRVALVVQAVAVLEGQEAQPLVKTELPILVAVVAVRDLGQAPIRAAQAAQASSS